MRYVRQCGVANAAQCNDANDGLNPETAWARLERAADYLNGDGEIIIVGPGVYREGNIDLTRSGSRAFPKVFAADSAGECTLDPAGPVRLDVARLEDTGFLILGASYVVVSGFEITNARVAGIQVRPASGLVGVTSVGVTLANNVIYGNGLTDRSRGIDIADAEDTTIFNNLIYRNAGNGIGALSAPRSKIINNTVYGHPRFGVVIAQKPPSTASPSPSPSSSASPSGTPSASPTPTATPGASSGSWLLNNIIADNATGAAAAFSVDVDQSSSCDYIGAFNLISADDGLSYSAETPRDLSDILADPGFVDAGNNDYRLRPNSAAIDAGSAPVGRLDLNNGSVLANGRDDAGPVDLGYHFGSATVPRFDEVPATTQELYVRSAGDDGRDGSSATEALRTIAAAVERARAVSRIVVGPGVYRETVALNATRPARPAGPVELFADALGRLTEDAPGRVVIDAHRAAAGINVVGHCSTVIDGFVVMNGGDDGIRLKSAHGSIVRNNTTHSNLARGVNVVDTDDAQIINNLSYANVGGIQIGGNDLDGGSHRTIVQSNTIYGNQADGILIGTGPVASTGTLVRYNIIDSNGQNGLQLDDNNRAGRSAVGFCAEYNIVYHPDRAKRYGPILAGNCELCSTAAAPCNDAMCIRTPEEQCELDPSTDENTMPPGFVRPVAGTDGCLGGRRFWDDAFWLTPGVRAIDFLKDAMVAAQSVGLGDRNTESCELRDRESLDAGFHALGECFTDLPALAGDCNGDSCVTVNETVTGVNIVLGRQSLSSCPAFDLNDDGRVMVNELVSAVNDLFCCGTVVTGP